MLLAQQIYAWLMPRRPNLTPRAATSLPDARYAWLSRFAAEARRLRPELDRRTLLIEAAMAHESMDDADPQPERAAHAWVAQAQ